MKSNQFHFPLWSRRGSLLAIVAMVCALAVWMIQAKGAELSESGSAFGTALRKPAGFPQLIAVEPLPMIDGQMCQLVPASGGTTLLASLQQQGLSSTSSREARTSTKLGRSPLGLIGQDPYSTFGSIAVDPVRGEIVVGGAHNAMLLVYDRLANTSPTATMTEPKRLIIGHQAKIDRNCGLYIDPKNGDIYSTSLDIQDLLVVHPHGASGDAVPVRELRTPPRNVSLTADEERQEIFMTVQQPPAVVVFRKMAQGTEAPLRILEGQRTLLVDPHGVAVDSKNNLLYVGNNTSFAEAKGKLARDTFLVSGDPNPRWNVPHRGDGSADTVPGSGRFELPSITVYPLQAKGDTPPLRVIKGPKTGFKWIARIDIDVEHQELYVANDADHSILVFRASDSGDVAPLRVLKGPNTGLRYPTDVFVDTKNDEIVVANAGNHSATVYSRTAKGDTAPLRTIRSAPEGTLAPMLVGPGALTYDSKRDEILVPN